MALHAVPIDLDGEHGVLEAFAQLDALADEPEFAFLSRWTTASTSGTSSEKLCVVARYRSTCLPVCQSSSSRADARAPEPCVPTEPRRQGRADGGGTHLAKDDATLSAPGLMPARGGLVPTIGHFAAHELTNRPVLSFWLLHGGGTTASPWVPGELTVPDGTVNAELAADWTRPCLVRVEDETDDRAVVGMNNLTMTCRLSDQVDAIIFCPVVTPVRE